MRPGRPIICSGTGWGYAAVSPKFASLRTGGLWHDWSFDVQATTAGRVMRHDTGSMAPSAAWFAGITPDAWADPAMPHCVMAMMEDRGSQQ